MFPKAVLQKHANDPHFPILADMLPGLFLFAGNSAISNYAAVPRELLHLFLANHNKAATTYFFDAAGCLLAAKSSLPSKILFTAFAQRSCTP